MNPTPAMKLAFRRIMEISFGKANTLPMGDSVITEYDMTSGITLIVTAKRNKKSSNVTFGVVAPNLNDYEKNCLLQDLSQ